MILKGSDKLIDFEEISKKLDSLKVKLHEIGDSLWHWKIRKWIKTTWRKDYWARFLGWF